MKKRSDNIKADARLGTRVIAGLKEAIAFERGELAGVRTRRVRLTARTARISPAPSFSRGEIRRIRSSLEMSQAVFAGALNVSRETVSAWEQGKRAPDGAAQRLLEFAASSPAMFRRRVMVSRGTRARQGTLASAAQRRSS